MTADLENRRPLRSRDTGLARGAARGLARVGVGPDLISAGSIVFALIGLALFWMAGRSASGSQWPFWLAAAVSIQLRLVCNLLDGMVAVEHGRGGPSGPIWNELPDRIADALFLVGAGYGAAAAGAAWAQAAGWIAACLAILTAYVRELGRGLGAPADFSGPGAKPQRMAVLTIAAVGAMFEPAWGGHGETLAAALVLIGLLCVVTVVRRTSHLAAFLAEKGGGQL